ncbi:hypothetical protein EDC01DRAFT_636475 [Geopyxis carbonaria]|nr:hypothetical protein EDC01DRAFT_636475 [Geopyxis carbonaria]
MLAKRDRSTYEESNNTNSPYITYGCSLPPVNSCARDDGSYLPLWKQEVTDERGRKRLHGAFTGGFSAGYFNTVGSKEDSGWTPAAFKSSRDHRLETNPARPEDFMDAEDLKDAEEARRLDTNKQFTGIGKHATNHVGVLMDLLMPAVQDTVGYTLLNKMGWKSGQGVGLRTIRQARFLYDEDNQETHQEGASFLLAPENAKIVTLRRKDNSQGLGYIKEATMNRSIEIQADVFPVHKSGFAPKPEVGPAFGVGVLNDDDDEDPYEIRPKTAYNRTINDGTRKGMHPSKSNRSLKGKPVFLSRKVRQEKTSLKQQKCYDGRLPISGFVLSGSTLDSVAEFPPPIAPSTWDISNRRSTWIPSSEISTALDARSRGQIIGEMPLPGKSVFDFLKPAARDRISSVTGKSNLPPALGQVPKSSRCPVSITSSIPDLDSRVAMAALDGGFVPYSDDLEKRARYISFLEFKSGTRTGLPDRKYGMVTQDWLKEMNEFVAAARLFKPLAGSMATRFTSSSLSQNTVKTQTEKNLLTCATPKSEDPSEEAAKLLMYGVLTRAVIDFAPSRLLSKRFNVRPLDNDFESRTTGVLPIKMTATQPTGSNATLNSLRISPGEQFHSCSTMVVNPDKNEALEDERAADEVFQAVFADD